MKSEKQKLKRKHKQKKINIETENKNVLKKRQSKLDYLEKERIRKEYFLNHGEWVTRD